jgi:uncharacterized membrane protein YkvA (DUF1232 family)
MQVINRLRLVARLLSDKRVPVYLKPLPFAGLLYLVWPADLLPDLVPILGQVDDLGVLILGVETFIRLSPPHIVAEHQADLLAGDSAPRGGGSDNVIDGDWKEVK